MYKLVALDMDGTLLKKDKTISEITIRAIAKAKQMGTKFVLATGRPISGIKSYLNVLNLNNENDYAISFNGAAIRKTKDKSIVGKKLLNYDDLIYLYKLSQKLNVNIHAFNGDECITPKFNKYTQHDVVNNNIQVKEVNFYDFKDKNLNIFKIMFADDKEKLDDVQKKLSDEVYEKYTVQRTGRFFLEFMSKGVNKGEGIRKLSSSLGIKREEVICIGDALNDVDMIKFAGLGVAMGNAIDEVKKSADFVTKTNEEDGVAYAIEKFILN